jgi:hypothetical protein
MHQQQLVVVNYYKNQLHGEEAMLVNQVRRQLAIPAQRVAKRKRNKKNRLYG